RHAVTRDVLDLFPDFTAPSWRPWRVFKACLEGDWLRGGAVQLYRACTGRTTPPAGPAAEADAIVGRRGGESRFAGAPAIEAACLRDWSQHLAPGEVATAAVIAADRAQARNVMQYVVGMIDQCPALALLVERRTAEGVEFTTRTRIEVTTCSARSSRGYSFCLVIADEAAFWRSETSVEPDVEVLQGIRPGLATLPGARLLVIASPYARRGALWTAFRAHYGQEGAPLVWRAATQTMNPSLPARVVEAAYRDDPASAAAEYGAEFRTDIEGFLTREVLDAAIVPGRQSLPPGRRVPYVAFCDPSGGAQDAMTLAIAHLEERQGRAVAILDDLTARRPPFSPEQVVEEFCITLALYDVTTVTGDRYGGEWPREQFRKHGVSYTPS